MLDRQKIRFWGNKHALKVDFPGSCAAHKMGRKSAYFLVRNEMKNEMKNIERLFFTELLIKKIKAKSTFILNQPAKSPIVPILPIGY